jgi:hypothetical protein
MASDQRAPRAKKGTSRASMKAVDQIVDRMKDLLKLMVTAKTAPLPTHCQQTMTFVTLSRWE